MNIGREYNISVGDFYSKIPSDKLLEILEEAVYDGLKLKFGELYETRGSHEESKPIPPKPRFFEESNDEPIEIQSNN
jgi:hypothetical protein